MTGSRYQQAKAIFLDACARAREERGDFLDDACGGDAVLRGEVESLLAFDAPEGPDTPLDGRRIGRYRLVRELGAGGMGVVWLGERADDAFEKQVAIKLIRRGMGTAEILARFRQERQVLARLEHPNIARLLDGGSTEDDTPYLVMELVAGTRIDRYCDERRLTIDERLVLFEVVCEAVQHAHRNLVIHRDLKCGNVLVTDDGAVKLLDFGIAKVLEAEAPDQAATVTDVRLRPLTPAYASPEQVRGEPMTTASDVYSLGVVLYELLTGHRPYNVDTGSAREIEFVICEDPPTRPSGVVTEDVCAARGTDRARLRRRLAGDLETIMLKALRKEPARRYASVEQLADDIRRHREGLPVRARPDTFGYRAAKFVRRHAVPVTAAFVVVVALVAASVISTQLFLDAKAAQRDAVAKGATAEQISRFLQEMLASVDPRVASDRDVALLRDLLGTAAKRIETELAAQPEAAAALHRTIGVTYKSLGLLEPAEAHLTRAVGLHRDLYGGDDLEYATSLYHRAVLHKECGEYAEAAAAQREVLAIRRPALGDHRDVGNTLCQLAVALEAVGQYEEAETCFREGVRVHGIDPGPASPELAVTLSLYGSFLKNQQRHEEAEPSLRDALRIARVAHGERHHAVASHLHNLAGLFKAAGDYDEAERHYREALAIMDETVAEDHPARAVTLNNLASVLQFKGDLEAAEAMFRDVLRLQRSILGSAHRDVGTTANNLAGLLRKTGQYDEAETLYREAIEIYSAALGPDHAWVGIVLASYAALMEAKGDLAATEQAVADALRVGRQHWADDHWRIATLESMRGGCLAGRGAFEDAEPLLRESHRVIEAQFGPDHAATRDAAARLVAMEEARRTGD